MTSISLPSGKISEAMVEAAYKVFAGKMLMYDEDRDLIERMLLAALSVPAPGTGGAEGPWCQPMKNGEHQPRQFIVYYEDASVGVATFDNEAEARAHWEQSNINWNCYLFGALPLASAPALSPTPVGEMVQCGWAYRDKRWEEDRWHVCGFDSKPREHEGRIVWPIYVEASRTALATEGGGT